MKTYKQLQDKFNKDVEELQKKCKHKKSKWYQNMWAPGHFNGEVKACLICNKTLKTRNTMGGDSWGITSSTKNNSNITGTN